MKTLYKFAGFAFIAINSCLATNAVAQVLQPANQGLGLSVAEDSSNQMNLYRISDNGVATLLHENIFPDSSLNTFDSSRSLVDRNTGKIYLLEPNSGGALRYRIYNAATDKFEGYTSFTGLPDNGSGPSFLGAAMQLNTIVRREGNELHIGENSLITTEANSTQEMYAKDENGNAIDINVTNGSDLLVNGTSVQTQITSNANGVSTNTSNISTNTSNITKNSNGITSNDTDIADLKNQLGGITSSNTKFTNSGVEVGGKRLISKSSDGVVSIGNNSIKFGNEAVGNQTMWATDQNGVVDINITNGTDLLINGVSVQGQIDDNKSAIQTNTRAIDNNRSNINNLGDGVAASTALTSALSALPTAATDAPFSCGIGSGAYSSRVAMGVGCATKLQERLSLNVGGSTVFGGASNYGGGSLDNVAVRGGFVFKLGNIESPAASNRQLQSKVEMLENANAKIIRENLAMKAKYSTIAAQNEALTARLERLEAIALGLKPAVNTASLK